MSELISMNEAASKIKDGDITVVGGFLGVGCPEKTMDALCASGAKDLTLMQRFRLYRQRTWKACGE